MIIEIILALIIGVIIGSITGLIPGIHINLVAFFLLSLVTAGYFAGFSPIILVVFIVSLSITHTFVDFVPSIFLGAPDEDSVLSVLPGHEMLIKGEGYGAVILTLFGSIIGIILILLFSPLFIFFLPTIYDYALKIMPLILILASCFLFYFEKNNRLWAIIIFFLAGFLGIASLNLNLKEPLLPLLTGLFGASSLITSISKKQKLPNQRIIKLRKLKIKKKSIAKSILASLIASPLCSFLPGLGSGQAAVIGSEVTGDLDRKEFLILLGSINTIVMGLSFVTLYTIQKSRTGSAAAISKLLETFSLNNLLIILAAVLISGILAFFLTIFIAKMFSKHISKISYNRLSLGILIFLSMVILIFSGFLGFLVFIVSTFTGLVCIHVGVRRTHLMGCLMLPTILIYLL
ncbi:MAG: tripartite tricarboxylate transporter permease [Candidatus Nanoarchaeia archaeon]|nr:tripartite tricarboxylate transporter permease [Candidatus Nanoarchaeia archaeon]MDD5741400.1 tripartite tricarboxylate transporter permease [Candidatus Nanoarchaeia archaeon]